MTDLREQLTRAGLLIPGGLDGIVGRGGIFEEVLLRFNALLSRTAAEADAEAVHFPPVMHRPDLERNGYLKSFPHLAAALHAVPPAGGTGDAGDQATGLMMVPAACYPIYPMLSTRGLLPPGGVLLDVHSWCFRREPSAEPTRLQSFRMHEHVRVGGPADVLAFREAAMETARALYAALQLPFTMEVANDPFFGRTGRLLASSQRERSLKFELLIPVNDGAEPTACCSFNYAEDLFTQTWGIAPADGGVAHSACVAFGLERTTLALFRHHGLDPSRWPAAVRAALGG